MQTLSNGDFNLGIVNNAEYIRHTTKAVAWPVQYLVFLKSQVILFFVTAIQQHDPENP